MICPFCGTILPDDAVRCGNCGAARNVEKKKNAGAWVPYMLLGILTAVGLAVYILTGII